MRQNVLLLVIGVLSFHVLLGQEMPNIIPPSPNAASLGIYGDIPVSKYNGTPNIGIPLFNIKSGEIEMPISLSYHAAGVKVAQEASWVGLGWSLNAGGVITRSIVDQDDFEGYISNDPLPEHNSVTYQLLCEGGYPTGSECAEEISELEDYYSMVKDGQPDVFFYNFFGYSGKLIFEKGNLTPYNVNQNSLSFSYDTTTKKWTALDDNGWKFIFGTTEWSSVASQTSNIPLSYPSTDFSVSEISSWYLDSVEAPNGDVISFTYTNIGNFKSQVSYGQVYRISKDYDADGNGLIVNDESGLGASPNPVSDYKATVVETVQQKILSRIDFNEGYLVFDSSQINRKDLLTETTNGNYNKGLSSITLFDLDDNEKKAYFFNYNYFRQDKLNQSNDDLYLRLKLETLQEGNKNSSGSWSYKPAYTFQYNDTPLPIKTSKSVDYWGCYNGRNNENILGYEFLDLSYPISARTVNELPVETMDTRVPEFAYIAPNAGGTMRVFIPGANMEPDVNYAKAAVLEEIKYPTGGVTRFDYQLNRYEREALFKDNIVEKTLSNSATNQTSFTISREAFIFIKFDFKNNNYNSDPYNSQVTANMEVVLEKSDGTDVLKFKPSDEADSIYGNYNTDEMHANVYVALEPGTYNLKAKDGGYVYLDLDLYAKILTKEPTTYKYGGGLRIANIDKYEHENDEYFYRDSFSYTGGELLTPLNFLFSETKLIYLNSNFNDGMCCYDTTLGGITNPVYESRNTIKVYNSSVIPLGNSAKGSPIGYDKVRISSGEMYYYQDPEYPDYNYVTNNSPSIVSEYYYINKRDTHFGKFFPNLPTKTFLENGLLTKEEHFNDGTIVKKVEYDYEKSSEVTIYGVSTLKPDTWYKYYQDINGNKVYTNVIGHFYEVSSEWWRLKNSIETTYDSNGNNPLVSTMEYFYDNFIHKKPTRTFTYASDGKTIINQTSYPQDLSNPTPAEVKLINQHKIVPIEKISYLDKNSNNIGESNEILKKSKNIYKDWGNNIVKPQYLESGKATGNYDREIEFISYYSNGKVKEVRIENGPSTVYVWGYQGEYPIAKIENAVFSDIPSTLYNSLISKSNLDFDDCLDSESCNEKNLRAELNKLRDPGVCPNLSNAQITTFTYNPLTGVTSETNVNGNIIYYKYDAFNRLTFVKDESGKILSQNEYNYQGQ